MTRNTNPRDWSRRYGSRGGTLDPKAVEHRYIDRAASDIERDLLGWLGLLPDSEAPNTEPNYEARLRALGAHLAAKGISIQECAAALALHYLSSTKGHARRVECVGRAKQLVSAARSLESIAVDAASLGEHLERAARDVAEEKFLEEVSNG